MARLDGCSFITAEIMCIAILFVVITFNRQLSGRSVFMYQHALPPFAAIYIFMERILDVGPGIRDTG
jgi:hypothetical protein